MASMHSLLLARKTTPCPDDSQLMHIFVVNEGSACVFIFHAHLPLCRQMMREAPWLSQSSCSGGQEPSGKYSSQSIACLTHVLGALICEVVCQWGVISLLTWPGIWTCLLHKISIHCQNLTAPVALAFFPQRHKLRINLESGARCTSSTLTPRVPSGRRKESNNV